MELTAESLDKFLNFLSRNRDEAGKQYEVVRAKLIHYFEWRRVEFADALADETIDRVARRIDEGVHVENVRSYLYGVARLVLMEHWPDLPPVPLDDVPEILRRQVEVEYESEPRLECLDSCLQKLSPDSRLLIMGYYQEERRAKIELRQQMATKLEIPLNALRIRAHRIRSTLQKCITECLAVSAATK